MQFNIIFKTIFEYSHKKFRFVSTEKNYAHRLACILFKWVLSHASIRNAFLSKVVLLYMLSDIATVDPIKKTFRNSTEDMWRRITEI